MSKRVEVREGDVWAVGSGVLVQIRERRVRDIAGTSMLLRKWQALDTDDELYTVLAQTARAWIESLGGEWVHVAEEKPATAKTLYVYENAVGAVQMWTSKLQPHAEGAFGMTLAGTITIAGVTK